jgi:hypothetical protein
MSNIVEDFLEADAPIRGQNYVCLSFISPEKVLKNKEVFKVTKFLEFLFKEKSVVDGNGNNIPTSAQKMLNDPSSITYESVSELYEDWKYKCDESVESEFQEKNDFHTTTRGLKVRGVYETDREAKIRAQVLQRRDPSFHVFVGQVGYWLPWDPSADGVSEQEYTEGALNTLVKKYKENIEQRDEHYEEVKREKLEKIRKENEEKRRKLVEQGISTTHGHSAEDSKKNIETLREMVDKADSSGVDVPISNTTLEKDESNGSNINQETNISESEPLNNFVTPNMVNLENTDPWMVRKMEEEAKKEEELLNSLKELSE